MLFYFYVRYFLVCETVFSRNSTIKLIFVAKYIIVHNRIIVVAAFVVAHRNDIIVAVDGKAVSGVRDVFEAIGLDCGKTLELRLLRGSQTINTTLTTVAEVSNKDQRPGRNI